MIASRAHSAQQAQKNLRATLAKLKANGEPTTLADITRDSTPDADNASLTYKRAAASITRKSAEWQRCDSWRDPQAYTTPLTPAELADITSIVKKNKRALDECVTARTQQPGDWHDKLVPPYLMAASKIDYDAVRSLGRLLDLDATLLHAQGHDSECVERLHDALRVARASLKRPSLVAHIIAGGTKYLACVSIDRLAPRLNSKTNRAPIESLIAALSDESALTTGRRFAFASERVLDIDLMTRFMKRNVPGYLHGRVPSDSAADIARDAVTMMNLLVKCEDAVGKPDWPDCHALIPRHFLMEIDRHPKHHQLAVILMPAADRLAKTDYRDLAQTRLASLALASRLYTFDHGKLPTTLKELVPRYIRAVPDDPMIAGGVTPLRLTSTHNDPRVYSVGDDGHDDGGETNADRDVVYRMNHHDIVVSLIAQPRKP